MYFGKIVTLCLSEGTPISSLVGSPGGPGGPGGPCRKSIKVRLLTGTIFVKLLISTGSKELQQKEQCRFAPARSMVLNL